MWYQDNPSKKIDVYTDSDNLTSTIETCDSSDACDGFSGKNLNDKNLNASKIS